MVGLSALLLALAVGCSKGTPPPLPPDPTPELITPKITVQDHRSLPPQPSTFAFADPQHGWVAEGNRVLATQDGGATWAPLPTVPNGVLAMSLVTPSVGWVGTDKGLLTLAPDGKDWVSVIGGPVAALDLVDPTHGWIVNDDQLKATADGGATWNSLPSPCKGGSFGLRLSFTSQTKGWVLCPGEPGAGSQSKSLYRTIDGGQSWITVAETGNLGTPPQGPLPRGGYVADLYFRDDTHGWISLARGTIIATDDGGQSWSGLPSIEVEAVFPGTVQFFSPTQGLAILQSGGQSILHSTQDGGMSWRPVYPALRPLASMPNQMLDAQTWVSAGSVADQSAILWTKDRGAHWQQVGSLGKSVDWLTFLDQKRGWALDHDGQVYGTADGGATWQPLAASPTGNEEHLFRLRFTSPENGFAVSGWGHIYQTQDGGKSFSLVSNQKATAQTAFANQSIGWRINDFHLEGTTDGGKQWQPLGPDTRVVELELVSPEVGWIIGGKIEGGMHQPALFGTQDGGKHWTRYELAGTKPGALRFADPQHGLLLDQDSRLFATADGGKSWTELP
jgi:photosystem II stability/assembly factor-like uncharacterized protein